MEGGRAVAQEGDLQVHFSLLLDQAEPMYKVGFDLRFEKTCLFDRYVWSLILGHRLASMYNSGIALLLNYKNRVKAFVGINANL